MIATTKFATTTSTARASLLLALAFGAFACAKSSKKEQAEALAPVANPAAAQSLVGSWNVSCYTAAADDTLVGAKAFNETLTFDGQGNYSRVENSFSDTLCTKALTKGVTFGTYTAGAAVSGVAGAFALDVKGRQNTLTLVDISNAKVPDLCKEGALLVANNPSKCDDSDLYQIAKVDGTVLLLGEFDSDDATTSPETRPTSLDENFPFNKAK